VRATLLLRCRSRGTGRTGSDRSTRAAISRDRVVQAALPLSGRPCNAAPERDLIGRLVTACRRPRRRGSRRGVLPRVSGRAVLVRAAGRFGRRPRRTARGRTGGGGLGGGHCGTCGARRRALAGRRQRQEGQEGAKSRCTQASGIHRGLRMDGSKFDRGPVPIVHAGGEMQLPARAGAIGHCRTAPHRAGDAACMPIIFPDTLLRHMIRMHAHRPSGIRSPE
jgi:hypothetical protein